MSSGGRPTADKTRIIVTSPALGTLAAPILARVAVKLRIATQYKAAYNHYHYHFYTTTIQQQQATVFRASAMQLPQNSVLCIKLGMH